MGSAVPIPLGEPLAKTRNPTRFSDHFGIDLAQLEARGAFDPILNADTPLFIDPLLLAQSEHAEMHAAEATWRSHFASVIQLLAATHARGDAPWRAVDRLFVATEFKGTCLGYGSGSIQGSGIGGELKQRLLTTAHQIVRLGIDDPTLFPLLALLEEDIGPDRISDLTTRVIAPHLGDFTTRVMQGFDLQLSPFQISGRTFNLPVNPFVTDRGRRPLPVVLVPKDVLRDLPVASDWSEVDDAKSHNEALRRRINEAIGAIWMAHSRKSKSENRRAFMQSREAFESLIAATSEIPKNPYDFDGDPDGLSGWLEMGRAFAEMYVPGLELREQTKAAVREVLDQIVEHFRHVVEERGLWKNLYDSNNQPHHEPYTQRLFYAMAVWICKQSDVGIDPESDAGTGPVDFVVSRGFHARIAVELKLSTNTRIVHGYTKQLETYKASQDTEEGLFAIVDVGGGEAQIEKVLALETEARNQRQKHSRVVVIDAKPKPSASKQ
jgi:hypothetical protein